ncbi:MAG: TIGR01459 family HAD-type hydrolase [Alphaproteobacteria bacterium]|nr:TIGR01459 family HAD-type hydrolase [Alphaproteobacteria bacterium]
MIPADFPVGLSKIADRYEAFVFDLWGVLHDGTALFAGVLPVFAGLRAAGKKIGILSNSPRPVVFAAANIANKFSLRQGEHYDALLTSGQLAYEALQERGDAWLSRLGQRCLTIGPAHETAPYLALGLQAAAEPENADFILCTGVAPGKEKLSDYEPQFSRWREAGLPLLCANPDRTVMRGTRLGIAGGSIAEAYRTAGGDVRDDFGKPYESVFKRIITELQSTPTRCLMIGDNLHTDIWGANSAGLRSMWITTGVHAPELERLGIGTHEQLRAYIAAQKRQATHMMSELRW